MTTVAWIFRPASTLFMIAALSLLLAAGPVLPPVEPQAETHSAAEAIVSVADEAAEQIRCLAQAIYYEGRGESLEGWRAIGHVVLNRVASPQYPKTICGVVFQGEHRRHRCQFSFACDGLADNPPNTPIWRNARLVARDLVLSEPEDFTLKATHYHARDVEPYWAKEFELTMELGGHLFYREAGDDASDSGPVTLSASADDSGF